MFIYFGCLLLFGGYYYRKPIVYNSIYTWVILEEYLNSFKNKYFRSKINIIQYKNTSIVEIFDNNFISKKYVYTKHSDLDSYIDSESESIKINDTNIDFNSKKLFISVLLKLKDTNNETNDIDLTKDLNLFINKNTKLTVDYPFTEAINNFLNLDLDLTENNFTWTLMDTNFTEYEGNSLIFSFDQDYKIIKN